LKKTTTYKQKKLKKTLPKTRMKPKDELEKKK
jgi:hypothetical protein